MELLRSVARGESNGWLMGWVRQWLEVALVEDYGAIGQPRTNRALLEHKGPGPLVAEQSLHAELPLGLEDSGPRPVVRRGNRQSRGRIRHLGAGAEGGDVGVVGRMMERLGFPLNARRPSACARRGSLWSSPGEHSP